MEKLQWDGVSREILTDAFTVAAEAVGPLRLHDVSPADIRKRHERILGCVKLYFKAVLLTAVAQCVQHAPGFVDIKLSRSARLPDFDLPINTIDDIEIGAPIYAQELVKSAMGGRLKGLDSMGHKLRALLKGQGKHEISFSRHAIANIDASLVSYILWLTLNLKLNEPRGRELIRRGMPVYRARIKTAQGTLREYADEWLSATGLDR